MACIIYHVFQTKQLPLTQIFNNNNNDNNNNNKFKKIPPTTRKQMEKDKERQTN